MVYPYDGGFMPQQQASQGTFDYSNRGSVPQQPYGSGTGVFNVNGTSPYGTNTTAPAPLPGSVMGQGQGGVSYFPSQDPGTGSNWDQLKASSVASGHDFFDPTGGVTVVGTPWLSPDELRAKTDALQTRNGTPYGGASGGAGGGGGGGGGSGQVGGGSGGIFNGGFVPNQQSGGPSVGGFPQFGGSPGNFLPGGMNQSVGGGFGQVGGGAGANQGPTGLMTAGPQNALNQYYNTAGYQLTNGQGAVNQFQASPGYQYAVDQAMRQVQGNAASRGLLDSGAALRGMTDRAYGMANQEFNNWQDRQNQMYNNYQNRLAGLAGGPVGAEQAYGMGQGMGANAMQTGSNIGSLLANQGNSLFGGIVGAGGAQAQNVSNAGNMQAQILAGNVATQLAAAALGNRQQY